MTTTISNRGGGMENESKNDEQNYKAYVTRTGDVSIYMGLVGFVFVMAFILAYGLYSFYIDLFFTPVSA